VSISPLRDSEPFSTATDDALGNLDMVGLLEELRNRRVSAPELTQAARARAHNAQVLNAVVSSIPDGHSPGSPTGPFAGIPTFVKDNEDIAGMVTTMGSRAIPRVEAGHDSRFVTQFRELGFGALGKSTLPEFGLTATTEPLSTGPTRNPWNLDHSTGGSSGGSAALVAAQVVPIAHANDGGGSVRIPASCCGLIGLKPTSGRIVLPESMDSLPIKFATQGVLTRTVRDTAAFYRELEELFPAPATMQPIGDVTGAGTKRLRIGLITGGPGGIPVAPDVIEATVAAGAKCEQLGHSVEPIEFPFPIQFGHDFLRFWALLAAGLEVGGKRMFGPEFDKSQLEPFTLGLSQFFRSVAVRAPGSVVRLRNFTQQYPRAFENYDVLLSPVLGHAPPQIGYLAPDIDAQQHMVRLLRYACFTAMHNIAGAPAISLPMGTSSDGMPIGAQFAAQFGEDRLLLELAYELETATTFNPPHAAI